MGSKHVEVGGGSNQVEQTVVRSIPDIANVDPTFGRGTSILMWLTLLLAIAFVGGYVWWTHRQSRPIVTYISSTAVNPQVPVGAELWIRVKGVRHEVCLGRAAWFAIRKGHVPQVCTLGETMRGYTGLGEFDIIEQVSINDDCVSFGDWILRTVTSFACIDGNHTILGQDIPFTVVPPGPHASLGEKK